MGLENLKSAFNNIQKNELSDYGGPHGQGVHGGLTNEFPSTPHNEHSELGDIDHNILSQLERPNSEVASKITFGSPNITDYSLGTGIHSGQDVYDELSQEKIKKRKFDETTLGKDQQLGIGQYTLETLYNINHTPVTDRPPIDTGRKDHDGNSIYINTLRPGMGSFKYMDIKANGGGFRQGSSGLGFGDGREPYIVNEIGSKTNTIGNNRDLIPFQAGLEDSSRLLKFYTSTAGLAYIAKENLTNIAIGAVPTNDIVKRPLSIQVGPDLNTLQKTILPPINNPLQGNTGFLNFTNQFRDLGSHLASARKPLQVEYSKRSSVGLPFGWLGDNIPVFKSAVFPPERLIEYSSSDPTKGFKKPRFLGLGQGPRWKSNDKIAQSVVEQPGPAEFFNYSEEDISNVQPLEDETFDIQKGDFYVRIKDLRDGKFIYFRGYVTGMTENVSPSWNPISYIGRSEPVYSYEKAERDMSFNLRVYPANIKEFDAMYEKMEKLTSLAYPEYIEDKNFTRMKPPFTELYIAHIGKKSKGQFGFIKSIAYTVNETGDWDALESLPRLFDIAISYQILSKRPPSLKTGSDGMGNFYGKTRMI